MLEDPADEELREEYYGKFTNITKDTKFKVGGQISREI